MEGLCSARQDLRAPAQCVSAFFDGKQTLSALQRTFEGAIHRTLRRQGSKLAWHNQFAEILVFEGKAQRRSTSQLGHVAISGEGKQGRGGAFKAQGVRWRIAFRRNVEFDLEIL